MGQPTSAGLLLYDQRSTGLHVLIAHPGGPFFAKKDAGHWSIPKGEVEAGEDFLGAARREFHEETNHRPPSRESAYIELGSIRQKQGKIVHAWAYSGAWDPDQFRCNDFTMEWPPRSGQIQAYPELDRAEMMPLDEARTYLKAVQHPFLDRLVAALGGSAAR